MGIPRTMRLLITLSSLSLILAQSTDLCETCDYKANTWEVLEFKVRGSDITQWMKHDDDIWTTFLSQQPGYISKMTKYASSCDLSSTSDCLVYSIVNWNTLEEWKNINQTMMDPIDEAFNEATKDLQWNFVRAVPDDYGV